MSLFGAIFGLFSCNAQNEKSDSAFKSVEVEEFAKVIADTELFALMCAQQTSMPKGI